MSIIKLQVKKEEIKQEIIAGCTTFLAMMYIIFVNPTLLQQAGMPYDAVLTATVIIAAVGCILMGVLANNPIAVAPTMGMNAFFTYTVVLQMHLPWRIALGTVFWAAIIFVLLTLFNVRVWLIKAIPTQLRFALSCGIGLFIALIGLRQAHFIVTNPATLVSLGTIHPETFLFLFGVVLIATLIAKRVPGALIIGIISTTLIAICFGRWFDSGHFLVQWHGLVSWPDFSTVMQMDLRHSLEWSLFPVTFTFLFTSLFDSMSTLVGVAEAGNLLDKNGLPQNIQPALFADAIASLFAGIMGSSTAGAYVESAAGVKEGGKTGLTAIVTGLLFLPFVFFAPLSQSIPTVATAPVLFIIGLFMAGSLSKIEWHNIENAFPAFIAVIIIPLASSITAGIIWALLAWTLIKALLAKWSEISITLWVVDIFAMLSLYFGYH